MNNILPIYYQIKETVKNRIITGRYKPGDKIPSENELVKKFNVSRLTVRQAITQLVHEGFLISKQGQGSFVTSDKEFIESFSIKFTGFINDLFYQIAKTTTKSVEIKKVPIPILVREKLEIDDKAEEIILVKRVRFKNDVSFAYTVNYIPLEIGVKITEERLYKKPLLQIMEQELGITFKESFETIEATFAGAEVAEKLNIPSGSPVLFVERVMYGGRKKPVEMTQTSYRGDLYKYVARLKRVRRNNTDLWLHDEGNIGSLKGE